MNLPTASDYDKKDLRVPSTIRNHPGVRYCVLGDEAGSDYRYFVLLRDGWTFTEGAKSDCTGGGFNRVADFHDAQAKAPA